MGLEFQDKLNLLGGAAGDEVACQSCAVNPTASVVTHRATQPIRAAQTFRAYDLQPIQRTTFVPSQSGLATNKPPRDLKPWLSSSIRSDGKRIPIVKTFRVQSESDHRSWLFGSNAHLARRYVGSASAPLILEHRYGI